MFSYYFLTIAALIGVASSTLIDSYTYDIPTDYPIQQNGETFILTMNSSTAATTYSMVTSSKILKFDILNNYGKDFKMELLSSYFNFTVSNHYCSLNGESQFFQADVINVTIDLNSLKIECGAHVFLLNGISTDNITSQVFFDVKYETLSTTNILCAFPKGALMFPEPTTTTDLPSPSSTMPSYAAKKGLSNLIIIIIIISSVVFFAFVIAVAVTVFLLKRFGRLCFKKRKPRPAYLPDSDQEVVGVPSTYTCPIYRKRQKRSVSVDTIKTTESAEKVPSKIKLYRDGEYANIKIESTMTAIPKDNTVV